MTYKALKEIWYERLKADGFEDIEEGEYLKRYHSFDFANKHSELIFREQYYKTCSDILNDLSQCPVFLVNTIDRIAWALHSEGVSLRNIAFKLEHLGFKRKNKDTVSKILRHVKKRWIENHLL